MPTAAQQITRLLAVIPWVVNRGGATISEIVDRFGYANEAELVHELDLLWLCGVPPYSPDTLMEAWVEDGRVEIKLAHWFRRPLRLSAAEGVALLAAGEAVLATRGADRSGPLASGLAKLRSALGPAAAQVEIEVEAGPTGLLEVIRDATEPGAMSGRALAIDYLNLGRNELTSRTIVPWRLAMRDGSWYVGAWCARAGEPRTFRLDRVRSFSDCGATQQGWPPDPSWFGDDWATSQWFGPGRGSTANSHGGAATAMAELVLAPEAAWVAEAYPVESSVATTAGITVRLPLVDPDWLVALLVRLGPAARAYSWTLSDSLAGRVADLARLMAQRYESV